MLGFMTFAGIHHERYMDQEYKNAIIHIGITIFADQG